MRSLLTRLFSPPLVSANRSQVWDTAKRRDLKKEESRQQEKVVSTENHEPTAKWQKDSSVSTRPGSYLNLFKSKLLREEKPSEAVKCANNQQENFKSQDNQVSFCENGEIGLKPDHAVVDCAIEFLDSQLEVRNQGDKSELDGKKGTQIEKILAQRKNDSSQNQPNSTAYPVSSFVRDSEKQVHKFPGHMAGNLSELCQAGQQRDFSQNHNNLIPHQQHHVFNQAEQVSQQQLQIRAPLSVHTNNVRSTLSLKEKNQEHSKPSLPEHCTEPIGIRCGESCRLPISLQQKQNSESSMSPTCQANLSFSQEMTSNQESRDFCIDGVISTLINLNNVSDTFEEDSSQIFL